MTLTSLPLLHIGPHNLLEWIIYISLGVILVAVGVHTVRDARWERTTLDEEEARWGPSLDGDEGADEDSAR